MPVEHYRFLDPWWLLLPDGGSAVIAVVGSGGRTTVLRRLAAHYRERGRTVLWTQTAAQPQPVDWASSGDGDLDEIRQALHGQGAVHVGGAREGSLRAGLATQRIEELRRELRPDIVLVDAHARCGKALRRREPAPIWPDPTHLALLVAPLWAVGRVLGPEQVEGIEELALDEEGRPRRIGSAELRDALLDESGRLLHQPPDGAVALPFLTGFGSYRDMDGMFELVEALWQAEGVRAVCLAELLGDERRDAADLRESGAGGLADAPLAGERIYAVYPSSLDEL